MKVKLIIIVVAILAVVAFYFTSTKDGVKKRFYFNVNNGKYPHLKPEDMNDRWRAEIDTLSLPDLKVLVKTGYSPSST